MRHRRSQWKAVAPSLVTCANPACGAKHLPHRACGTCGQYGARADRRQVLDLTHARQADGITAYDELMSARDPAATELLDRALTHRSYAYENGGLPTNERLEFLGDSVLGVVVTETLYLTHPDLSEGRLAKLRAAVVNARASWGLARASASAPTSSWGVARRRPVAATRPRSCPTRSRP